MMAYEALKAVAESYPPQGRDSLLELAQEYRRRHDREILDVARIATDVSLDDVTSLGREPDPDPQLLEAFKRQYPNVDLESLKGISEDALKGWANGVKGKYFEVLVRDRLNDGERLGELQLLPGQTAILADSPTQAGWDLRITNADGSTAENSQLKATKAMAYIKATESMAYVKRALDKYPDIRVAAPSEVDSEADKIIDTAISHGQLEKLTEAQLGELSEGSIEDLWDKAAEGAFDSVPFVSMAMTGVIEGRNWLTGRSTFQESLRRAAKRTGRAAAYDTLGTVLAPTGVAIPVMALLRIAEGRVSRRIALGDRLEAMTVELRQLQP